MATVAYITGWRTLSELLPLEWRQVECNGGTLRRDPGTTKNRDSRVFPLISELLFFCRCHGIQLEAYSPLTRGQRIEHPVVAGLADKYSSDPRPPGTPT